MSWSAMHWFQLLSLLFTVVHAALECPVSVDKIVDLTHPFDDTTLEYPGLERFRLIFTHNETTPEGYWLQMEKYRSDIHVGTHFDAPCHIEKGKWCLHQIPVNRFIAPAAVVDITYRSSKNPDANLEVEDLVRWEQENRRTLDGTIVLVNSGWGEKWSDPEAFLGTTSGDLSKLHFPGVSAEAAQWLAYNREIYGLGIDTTSLDNGQAKQRKAHEALFSVNIYGIENVANLDKLPSYGATLFVFPMKITGSSGAPVRVIALLP